MKKNSNYLLFKQGFKGIFKFKIQFIIILILSFLSVFILTTSLTLKDRLNHTYNEVVKSVDKFDYEYTETLYGEAGIVEKKISQNLFSSLIDVDKYSTLKDSKVLNLEFNKIYGNETFITESFASDEMKNLFVNGYDEKDNQINKGLNKEELKNNINNPWFNFSSRKIVLNHFYKDIVAGFEKHNYLVETPLWSWIKTLNKEHIKNDYEIIENLDRGQYESIKEKELFVYATNLFTGMFAFIANLQEFLNTNLDSKDIISNSDIYTIVTGNEINSNPKNQQDWIVTNENMYAINKEKDSYKKFIEVENFTNSKYIAEGIYKNGLKGISNPIFKLNSTEEYKNNIMNISALKLESNTANDDWSTRFDVFNTAQLDKKMYEEIFESIYSNETKTSSNYDWILKGFLYSSRAVGQSDIKQYYIGNNLILIYKIQLKIASLYSHINIEMRKEFTTFENVSQIQYKAVILDDSTKTKVKILNPNKGGRMPKNRGEILVSEQFARARKIKLFQEIKVGSQNYTVTGLATDTFSYYPIVNEDLPLPQTKSSSLIYGTAETFRPIKSNSESAHGVSVGASQFKHFMWLNSDSDLNKFNEVFVPANQLRTFNDSPYKMVWTLQPLVVLVYTVSTVFVSCVIALIALVGLIISIKKTISANSKQIGILKALGAKPMNISLSYIAQAVIITLVVIPLSWIVGVLAQSAYIHLFTPYFSIQLYQLVIPISSLLISILVFGTIFILISFFVAYKLTNKPVIEILRVKDEKISHSRTLNFLNRTIFNKSKFTLKFSLTLASANKRNIYLMAIIVFMTSFLVSIGFSIPATVTSTKNAYYKNVNYSNSYKYTELVSNAPLSKGAISYSKNLDEIDADYKMHGNIKSYSNPGNYFESTSDVSPISKYIYLGLKDDKPNYTNTFKYIVSDDANSTNGEEAKTGLFDLITEQFGNNFANGVGSQFSIGTIEQILGLITNSIYDATNESSEEILTDLQAQNKYDLITKNLTQAIPLIIGSVLGTSGSTTGDWKDQLLSTIVKAAPSFVQNYIQDPSRVEQYAFGYGVKKVIKNEDTLATNIAFENENLSANVVGINSNQKAYSISDNDKEKLFISNETLSKLEKVFNNTWEGRSIIENGFKYYDSSSETINIPIMANKQSFSAYNLSKNKSINNVKTWNNQLAFENYRDKKYDILPKEAWVYNDSDFLTSDYYNKFNEDQKIKIKEDRTGSIDSNSNYLNLYDLDNNKFTFRNLYTEKKLDKNSYLFNDIALNVKQEGSSYVRPYYEFSNVELYIPKELIDDHNKINGFQKWANKNISSQNSDVEDYFNDKILSSEVPTFVKNAWESKYGKEVSNKEYIKIKPYALEYSLTAEKSKNRGLENILDPENDYIWYSKAIQAGLLKQENRNVEYLNKNLKINFENIGVLNSYNGRLILSDQGLINLMSNYSTAYKYHINYNLFNDGVKYKAGETITSPTGNKIVSSFDKYEVHSELEDLYLDNYLDILNGKKDSLQYTQMMWNNSKLSNVDEPIDLTTGFIQTTNENNGLLLLGQKQVGNISSNDKLITQVNSQKLLSTEKELINQITQLAISIAMLIIVSVIITSSLLIVLVGDIYITNYQRFMILMKSFGYSNWKVQKYAFSTVTIYSAIGWLLATALAWGACSLILFSMQYFGLAMPFMLSWWPLVASLAVVTTSYFGSLLITSRKLRKGDPAGLLMETNE